jgi:1-phosphofructokinase family hexose kinase
MESRPGGKGVNVARVLASLGEPVLATGLADEHFGALVRQAGVQADFVAALPSVRRTVVVHERSGNRTTGLWEPGTTPRDSTAAATQLMGRVERLLGDTEALVVSGSVPVGVDPGLPATLARLATAKGVPVVVDLDDAPLKIAAEASGAVMTPNLEELHRLVGRDGALDVVAEAAEVSRRTGASVVVTLGPAGMVAVTDHGTWHARPPEPVVGNPTGAGDSAVAAIARGLARRHPWPVILADAVAISAAAVASPVAGEVDLERYAAWRNAVPVVAVDSLMTAGAS